jgi:hypothetical protein
MPEPVDQAPGGDHAHQLRQLGIGVVQQHHVRVLAEQGDDAADNTQVWRVGGVEKHLAAPHAKQQAGRQLHQERKRVDGAPDGAVLREPRAPHADDADTVLLDDPRTPLPGLGGAVGRLRRDHVDVRALPDQVVSELGQQLAGGGNVRHVVLVQDDDAKLVGRRWALCGHGGSGMSRFAAVDAPLQDFGPRRTAPRHEPVRPCRRSKPERHGPGPRPRIIASATTGPHCSWPSAGRPVPRGATDTRRSGTPPCRPPL